MNDNESFDLIRDSDAYIVAYGSNVDGKNGFSVRVRFKGYHNDILGLVAKIMGSVADDMDTDFENVINAARYIHYSNKNESEE